MCPGQKDTLLTAYLKAGHLITSMLLSLGNSYFNAITCIYTDRIGTAGHIG